MNLFDFLGEVFGFFNPLWKGVLKVRERQPVPEGLDVGFWRVRLSEIGRRDEAEELQVLFGSFRDFRSN